MSGISGPPMVSILIKAFNESRNIDAAIASAWSARHEIAPLPLEIVVADGLSEDDTARRAARWSSHAPVRVVQLVDAADRGCGSGVELGFVWSRGCWVLLMDADMTLQPGFLKAALKHLQEHPLVAGVGGVITDRATRNGTDLIRQANGLGRRTGPRPWLEGGGLYRRESIAQAGGHAGDRRLAAFEEADLGLRLHRAGWQLHRLPVESMQHDGHPMATMALLRKRWQQGRAQAAGRLLRLHAGRRGGGRVLGLLAHPMLVGLAWTAHAALLAAAPAGTRLTVLGWSAAGLVTASAAQALRKRSVTHVTTAWLDWHLMLAGILKGLLTPLPRRPDAPPSRLIAPAAECPVATSSSCPA